MHIALYNHNIFMGFSCIYDFILNLYILFTFMLYFETVIFLMTILLRILCVFTHKVYLQYSFQNIQFRGKENSTLGLDFLFIFENNIKSAVSKVEEKAETNPYF